MEFFICVFDFISVTGIHDHKFIGSSRVDLQKSLAWYSVTQWGFGPIPVEE